MITGINPASMIAIAAATALLPLLLSICTSYLKFSIVLGLLRSGIGAQNIPGALVVAALSLGLTICVMRPVFNETLQLLQTLPVQEALDKPSLKSWEMLLPLREPLQRFLERNAGVRELETFAALQKRSDVLGQEKDFAVITAAFVLSELKEAFSLGFLLLLPFLVIDTVIANILVGMGMYMVSPVLITLPLKLLLFVVADGWLLLIEGLANSYQ